MTKDVADTPNYVPSGKGFVDDPARPILVYARTRAAGATIPPHRHPRSQLLWAWQGVLRVTSAGCVWIVPPSHAVWIPGGTLHDVVTETDVEIRNLYVDPSCPIRAEPEGQCSVLLLTPFMRELILRLGGADMRAPFDAPLRRLCAVALDEIEALEEAPLNLPGGQDPRLLRLTRHLRGHPEDPRHLNQLAAIAGASPRTLERLFRRETGLTFRQWRSRLKLLAAIELLSRGQSSTAIAWSLGYRSPSAFVAAFRQHFGRAPQAFLHSWQQGAAGSARIGLPAGE
ncbi:helix-turn-helix transcriptional regulator [Tropicimonas sp. IMCC34043]|uniref:AraC family transcriptional regulator n=1 Tax=Tropicimonas sp. IMCC34043 TaxID=2248760 RepID=UPI000E26A28B|nr:helix-turn-helix transcriptional regulator [Tropicimonas sp. IMCC34043]